MPRQKIYLRKSSARYDGGSEVQEQSEGYQATPHVSQSKNITETEKSLLRKNRSYVNFREYVRQNLQTSKDHLERRTPKEFTPHLPESTYKFDYTKRSLQIEDIPRVKHHFFEQMKPEGRIDMISVQKHDFKGSQTTRSQRMQQARPLSSNSHFQGKSTYATTFINWKIGDQTELIPSNHPTVLKDMPFMGRSLYKDCYKGLQSPPAQSFKGVNMFRSPLNPPNMPTVKESTTMIDFKPFKMGGRTGNATASRAQLMSPSFAGQYKTNYQKDFTNKIEEEQQMNDEYEQI